MAQSSRYAPRVRAAHAYSGLSKPEFAAKLHISPRQVGRLESGETEPNMELRQAIARVTGVPADFMERGWAAVTLPDGDSRLDALERRLVDIETTLHRPELEQLLNDQPAAEAFADLRARTAPPQPTRRGNRRSA